MSGIALPPCVAGQSDWSKTARTDVGRLARLSANALLCGPGGSGKSDIARWVHRAGRRKANPFVPVRCDLLSGDLLRSQLFGHAKGMFSAAETSGCFRSAGTGTIYLSHLDALDLSAQAELASSLTSRRVIPLGNSVPRRFYARVIGSIECNAEEAVAEGRFDARLAACFASILYTLPLCDRLDDLESLVNRLLSDFSDRAEGESPRISMPAQAWMKSYAWPGNFAELSRAIQRIADGHKRTSVVSLAMVRSSVRQGLHMAAYQSTPVPERFAGFSALRKQQIERCRQSMTESGPVVHDADPRRCRPLDD